MGVAVIEAATAAAAAAAATAAGAAAGTAGATATAAEHEKTKEEFRNYASSAKQLAVAAFYKEQHEKQTYDFVQSMHTKYLSFNHFEMGVWEALEYLDTFVDKSDPDTDNSQMQHALQTAEAIREQHPDKEWMQVAGLIHDLGKILSLVCNEPQWSVVGDTFPVGCAFSPKNVFAADFAANPDAQHPVYSTEYGVYAPVCGLRNVRMSWGHDEYLYHVCVSNGATLPEEALYMIRFHSFYPWHKEDAYTHLCDDHDREMLPWVRLFNQYDLYSKARPKMDVAALKPYYQNLIGKYFPSSLRW